MSEQLDDTGKLKHLLTLQDMPQGVLETLLKRADELAEHAHGGSAMRDALAGKALCTLFFEASTRTRCSFSLAVQRLGADLLNFDASTASTTKGETDVDTLKTLEAMGVHGFIVRHKTDGAVAALAREALPGTVLINAGDGRSNHPTQGLLDMLTLQQAMGPDFSAMKVLIVGDVKHSRVARSDLHALHALGAGEVRVCGPASLLPDDNTLHGCMVGDDLDAMLEGVDAVMMLRLQRERMVEGLVASLDDYHRHFGLNTERLRRAAPDAIVMHPGPMNRGIEITDEVADGPQSRVLQQVANGVAVRMAVLEALLG